MLERIIAGADTHCRSDFVNDVRCISDETVQRFIEGQLTGAHEESTRKHLDLCAECRALVADLVRDESIDDASAAASGFALPPAAISIRKGERIADKYTVGDVIGHGGMGYVVSARHDQLEAAVAIKVLRSELALEPSSVARFVREAQVAARIRSDHCVRVYDVGSIPGGVPYIVMERLEGRPLSTVLTREQPLEPGRVVKWIIEACDAVGEAHEHGIVHRDLKPQNLFLADRGSHREPWLKVLDFGLAKQLRGAGLTLPEELLGTPHYMAPEQIRDPRNVGPAADIWALGACLYRLLTAVHPFPGLQRTAICAAIIANDPVPIRSLRANLRADLASIVHACLTKDPTGRPDSARKLQEALLKIA